ncbi:MAG TPA: UbiA family prenyltransferase, partial [Gemmataceae bacterium]|nr:UbiA family prenyltransferase [Gemmataceae bacterium]
MSDIGMGAVVAWSLGTPIASWPSFLMLLISSSCVYLAGMVLNDVADVDVDRSERGFRPIPSGRISRNAALIIGVILLGLGLSSSALVRLEGSRPLMTCCVLVLAVVAYDFSPFNWLRLVLMPTCRFLNVLLGMSAADLAVLPWNV